MDNENRLSVLISSYKELFSVRQMALCAMMLALSVVLGRFSIYLTPSIKISVAYLPFALAGMYAGPFAAMLVGALNDLIGVLLFPAGTPFFGYTLTAALTGLTFGVFFYQKQPKLWTIILARLIIVVFWHMCLNTYWSSILMGDSFIVLFPARALKSLIQYPIDILLLYLLLRFAARVRPPAGSGTKRQNS